ncbi:hypothetical protein AVEN_251050-1 [Araneus ventricosus]|uniref:Uncharacterized protein n=1 Tax=Araneus ventricosus TaxID=182803 RepID=A0A4Y2DLS5_ARAVE|nr:hypothetical protein AVEN_251050-1 [Araneus ventricosus]
MPCERRKFFTALHTSSLLRKRRPYRTDFNAGKKIKMGAEGPHVDHKTARMAISLEVFCSWTIMQDPIQLGTQKNTFVAWHGRDWITRNTDLHLSSPFSCIEVSTIGTSLSKQ